MQIGTPSFLSMAMQVIKPRSENLKLQSGCRLLHWLVRRALTLLSWYCFRHHDFGRISCSVQTYYALWLEVSHSVADEQWSLNEGDNLQVSVLYRPCYFETVLIASMETERSPSQVLVPLDTSEITCRWCRAQNCINNWLYISYKAKVT